MWEKLGLITKSDCMSVTDLNQTATYKCHIADVCSKSHKDFHDYCLFNMSDQLVVGIAFSCFWLKNHKNIVLRHSMTIKQHDHQAVFVLLRPRVTQLTKNGLNAQQQSLHSCKIQQQSCESWQINCVFRLSLGLSTQIMEFE